MSAGNCLVFTRLRFILFVIKRLVTFSPLVILTLVFHNLDPSRSVYIKVPLILKVTFTTGKLINFNHDLDGHEGGDIMCKQTLTSNVS